MQIFIRLARTLVEYNASSALSKYVFFIEIHKDIMWQT